MDQYFFHIVCSTVIKQTTISDHAAVSLTLLPSNTSRPKGTGCEDAVRPH